MSLGDFIIVQTSWSVQKPYTNLGSIDYYISRPNGTDRSLYFPLSESDYFAFSPEEYFCCIWNSELMVLPFQQFNTDVLLPSGLRDFSALLGFFKFWLSSLILLLWYFVQR